MNINHQPAILFQRSYQALRDSVGLLSLASHCSSLSTSFNFQLPGESSDGRAAEENGWGTQMVFSFQTTGLLAMKGENKVLPVFGRHTQSFSWL